MANLTAPNFTPAAAVSRLTPSGAVAPGEIVKGNVLVNEMPGGAAGAKNPWGCPVISNGECADDRCVTERRRSQINWCGAVVADWRTVGCRNLDSRCARPAGDFKRLANTSSTPFFSMAIRHVPGKLLIGPPPRFHQKNPLVT